MGNGNDDPHMDRRRATGALAAQTGSRFHRRKALFGHRSYAWHAAVVRGLHQRGWRVVSDVAIEDLERAGSRLPYVHCYRRRLRAADFAGYRDAALMRESGRLTLAA